MPLMPGADCHLHVFDPSRYAYQADVAYKPHPGQEGTPEQFYRGSTLFRARINDSKILRWLPAAKNYRKVLCENLQHFFEFQ